MLRNTVINSVFFFYPIGNTPAVCLTQHLLPEQNADILLLGCGDARNILFTAYTSPERRLDVTCCDIEPAILARNIVLFTLLIDDTSGVTSDSIWNIYYHLYLDDRSFDLLSSQAERLLSVSSDLQDWQASKYGKKIRFCDHRTFEKIKDMWKQYATRHLTPEGQKKREKEYEQNISKAREAKEKYLAKAVGISGIRSAAPVAIKALHDLPNAYHYFWKHGSVDQSKDLKQRLKHPNPAFASLSDPALTLHYGLDPLLGFHLATAYAPLTSESPLSPQKQETSIGTVVEATRLQFRQWCKSFQTFVSNGSVVRFFSGDAIAFCHTLQGAAIVEGGNEANFHCDNWTFQKLKLDGGDYENSALLAPVKFDTIDSSNLIDHLGPLNMLVATAPLLADKATSVLFTEMLVRHESNFRDRMDNLLCGDFGTVSLLLGLGAVEFWTNATSISNVDEGMIDAVSGSFGRKPGQGSGQLRASFCWKRLSSHSASQLPASAASSNPSMNLKIEATALARLLLIVYQAMFCQENITSLLANLKTQGTQKMSNPYYNRASFAALVRYVKTIITTDWDQTIKIFLDIVEQDNSLVSIARNFLQELYVYFHVFGVDTTDVLQASSEMFDLKASKQFSSWDKVPSVLCVTIKVPSSKIKRLTDLPLGELGTPSLCCTVQSSRDAFNQWANNFTAVQTAHGKLKQIGSKEDANFRLEVDEDSERWAGKSPLIVSFFAPTWVLLQEPDTALVACGLQVTPHAVKFARSLGQELRIFETTLGESKDVHITRFMPNMNGYPKLSGLSNSFTSDGTSSFKHAILGNVEPEGRKITSITHRIDFNSKEAKTKLLDQSSAVEVKFQDPMTAELIFSKSLKCKVSFPVPVSSFRRRLRIARKSSYVEIIAPILSSLDTDCPSEFMFPLSLLPKTADIKCALPVNWNMPYVNLSTLPILDISKKSATQLSWLHTHTSLSFSSREKRIRESNMASSTPSPNTRVDFKDGVFSMFMHAAGLQGAPQMQAFGLMRSDGTGVHVLLFVSCLRLDLGNHTVILDAAALPLTHALVAERSVQRVLAGLNGSGRLCPINTEAEELRLWKRLLPAWAERCRTWTHQEADCAYLKTEGGAVPAADGLEDGENPLCRCGRGKQIPEGILGDAGPKIPGLEDLLRRHATRVAISPVFAVPWVEDCFLMDSAGTDEADLSDRSAGLGSGSGKPRCGACGSEKKKTEGSGGSGTSEALLTCMRCKTARYCCKECQRADWKEHKRGCVAE